MTNRKLLMLACFFPPEGGAGAQRPFKFSKYLPDFGWSTTVISREISRPGTNAEQFPLDESFSGPNRKSNTCVVHRIPSEGNTRKFFHLDPYEEWSNAAGEKAAELLTSEDFDCVLITMSPFSLVRAIPLIRAVSDVPIVLDFRDPWVFDGWQAMSSYFHWLYHYRQMRKAIRNSNCVIANTSEVGKIFKKSFPWLSEKNLAVIENGYDQQDFTAKIEHTKTAADEFRIVYAGRLFIEFSLPESGLKRLLKRLIYYSSERMDYSGRSLAHLISALKILKTDNPAFFEKIHVRCLGTTNEAEIKYIRDNQLEAKIELCGYQPHSESVAQIRNADALFLPLHDLPDGHRSRIVPGKTYEYLATGNTIIGCLPEGDARELVEKCGNFVLAKPTDPQEIAGALIEAEKLSRNNQHGDFPLPWIER